MTIYCRLSFSLVIVLKMASTNAPGSVASNSEEFYARLGCPLTATTAQLREAFTRLVLTKHPDKGGDVKEFSQLYEAYEVLIDPR
jgi:curved DNA-binding protein CbpA